VPLDIGDYALIGDCETAALVGRDGSIDWLCWPRFDSDACFAALLGRPDNGRWLIVPSDETRAVTRCYREHTLVLETRFETDTGAVTLIDFMPPRTATSDLVRIVRCDRGCVRMHMELVLRFDYGAIVPWVSRVDDRTIRAIAGPDMVVVHGDAEMHGEDLRTVSEFELEAGQFTAFSLTYCASHLPVPAPPDVQESLALTEAYWRDWVRDGTGVGPLDEVTRSLITLRALIYAPTGGIVAAPTTSLPEHPGGTRNWDYRYCWLRDATMSLLSLMNAGYRAEAAAWRDWLVRAVAGSPSQLQIMYGLAGERRLDEWEVDWLDGYLDSRPVRVGNEAHDQLQLDVYGEVMDALYQSQRGGIVGTEAGWALQKAMLSHLEQCWPEPDSGIWEMRGPPRHFTHSKVMAWLAFDRGIAMVEEFGLDGPVETWREQRAAIYDDVCAHGYDDKLGHFIQSYGSNQLDASLLLLAEVGFVEPDDPRYVRTVAAIERVLLRDGLLLRYDTGTAEDHLPPGEGAFIACSFWLVDAYVLTGRLDDAQRLYERLLALRNDVGLLAEEYDPSRCRLLGNFPQAFSHVALVDSAYNLFHARKPAEQRTPHSARRLGRRGKGAGVEASGTPSQRC
jgi:GH15 family glucan-1,4-alpha-glucosidase